MVLCDPRRQNKDMGMKSQGNKFHSNRSTKELTTFLTLTDVSKDKKGKKKRKRKKLGNLTSPQVNPNPYGNWR